MTKNSTLCFNFIQRIGWEKPHNHGTLEPFQILIGPPSMLPTPPLCFVFRRKKISWGGWPPLKPVPGAEHYDPFCQILSINWYQFLYWNYSQVRTHITLTFILRKFSLPYFPYGGKKRPQINANRVISEMWIVTFIRLVR